MPAIAPAVAHQEAERHRDHGHDQREQRHGELAVEAHLQLDRIEAALLQIRDVASRSMKFICVSSTTSFRNQPGVSVSSGNVVAW